MMTFAAVRHPDKYWAVCHFDLSPHRGCATPIESKTTGELLLYTYDAFSINNNNNFKSRVVAFIL